jgi:hypothetical protein
LSDTFDEHLAQALASLADVGTRQLHATAEALERRRNGLPDFVSVFRDVAYSRELGSAPKLADFHLRQAVKYGGDELTERIADAEAPFWWHVREALRARQELPGSIDAEG